MFNKIITVLFLILFLPINIWAQYLNTSVVDIIGYTQTYSARDSGMGKTGISSANDVSSIYYNPAVLCNLKKPQISVLYSINDSNAISIFGVEDFKRIENINVGAILPVSWGAIGFLKSNLYNLKTGFQFEVYVFIDNVPTSRIVDYLEETLIEQFTLSGSFKVGNICNIGINLDYLNLKKKIEIKELNILPAISKPFYAAGLGIHKSFKTGIDWGFFIKMKQEITEQELKQFVNIGYIEKIELGIGITKKIKNNLYCLDILYRPLHKYKENVAQGQNYDVHLGAEQLIPLKKVTFFVREGYYTNYTLTQYNYTSYFSNKKTFNFQQDFVTVGFGFMVNHFKIDLSLEKSFNDKDLSTSIFNSSLTYIF